MGARAGGRRLPGRRRRHSGLGADKMSAVGAARRGGDLSGVRRQLGLGSDSGQRGRAEPAPLTMASSPQVQRAAGSPQALAGPGALSGAWLAKEEQYK